MDGCVESLNLQNVISYKFLQQFLMLRVVVKLCWTKIVNLWSFILFCLGYSNRQVEISRKLLNFSSQPTIDPQCFLFEGARYSIERYLLILFEKYSMEISLKQTSDKVSFDRKYPRKLLMELENFAILYVLLFI